MSERFCGRSPGRGPAAGLPGMANSDPGSSVDRATTEAQRRDNSPQHFTAADRCREATNHKLRPSILRRSRNADQIMTILQKKRLLAVTTFAACAAIPGLAQEAPVAGATPQAGTGEDIIVLTPFEVTANSDTGYVATETLAGTRIRTNLGDVGSAITVLTKDFLSDIGATDSSTLLQYTPNAEVAGTRSTYTGLGNMQGVDETASLRSPSGAQRMRACSTGAPQARGSVGRLTCGGSG